MSDQRSSVRARRWRFWDRSVRTKIVGLVVTLAALFAVVGGAGAVALYRSGGYLEELADLTSGLQHSIDELTTAQVRSHLLLRSAVMSPDPAQRTQYLTSSAWNDREADRLIEEISGYEQSQSRQWSDFVDRWQAWTSYRDGTLVDLAQAGDIAGYEQAVAASPVADAASGSRSLGLAQQGISTQVSEAMSRAQTEVRWSIIALATAFTVLTAMVVVVTIAMTRRLVRGLHEVRDVVDALAQGDLTVTAEVRDADELGQMAQALTSAQDSLRGMLREVVQAAEDVASSSQQVSASTGEVGASMTDSAQRAESVAGTVEEISSSVQTVAAGTEQMGASIQEISRNAQDAVRVAAEALEAAESTNVSVTALGAASEEIGDVVKLITSIAEQTNLLALNATIEAARAGEAGKGFAVVAGEVKELAQETATATGRIAVQVEGIQRGASDTVAAIAQISEVIGRINDAQTTIASAVEEQTSTTQEIARSVSEAAAGTVTVAESTSVMAESAVGSRYSLEEMRPLVDSLVDTAGRLRSEVAVFRF